MSSTYHSTEKQNDDCFIRNVLQRVREGQDNSKAEVKPQTEKQTHDLEELREPSHDEQGVKIKDMTEGERDEKDTKPKEKIQETLHSSPKIDKKSNVDSNAPRIGHVHFDLVALLQEMGYMKVLRKSKSPISSLRRKRRSIPSETKSMNGSLESSPQSRTTGSPINNNDSGRTKTVLMERGFTRADNEHLDDAFDALRIAIGELTVIEEKSDEPQDIIAKQRQIYEDMKKNVAKNAIVGMKMVDGSPKETETSRPYYSALSSPRSLASTPRTRVSVSSMFARSTYNSPRTTLSSDATVFDRLYHTSPRLQRSAGREEASEDDMKECTFSPRIETRSRELSKNKPSLMERQKAMETRREKRLEAIREQIESKRVQSSTFSPNINEKYQKTKRSVNILLSWKEKRDENLRFKRQERSEKSRKKYTFSPTLSEKTVKIVNRRRSKELKNTT